ncbi:Serine/threonine-protein kinase AtPK2/AtPK19 [Porphyridium purpureum]|uniref:non-specific serine/threonine protein kinase n=1 Tax=Porphyridium purpureum TaxID=35688 RepID=A0A5J4YYJ0_PORPP|nr:Serine/threonine-protein kinase AtPK2/AtPK19 [Porphyridium purpureum]|eukprot:POR1514..scf208_2
MASTKTGGFLGSLFAKRDDSFHNEEEEKHSMSSPNGVANSKKIARGKSAGGAEAKKSLAGNWSDVASVSSSRFAPDPLALLRKTPAEVGAPNVAVKTSKAVIGGWETYFVELRGSMICCFRDKVKKWTGPEEDAQLVVLADVVGCELSRPKANVLRLKQSKGIMELKLDTKSLADRWEHALQLACDERDMGIDDFDYLAPIGKGAAGKVFFVRDKKTGERLALKVIDKRLSVFDCQSSYRHAVDERLLLQLVGSHPFFVQLRYAFQSRTKLYLVTEFCDGGDLFFYLHAQQRPLTEREARRVVAETVLALSELHRLGFIYRDLKPENILLDAQGHIRLADFGLSKKLDIAPRPANAKQNELLNRGLTRTKTVCGTHAYVAPEMVSGSSYGLSVDIWTLGIFAYHILVGRPPYSAKTLTEVKRNFEKVKVRFYSDIMGTETVNFLMKLLDRNAERRLGCGPEGIEELKTDPFFSKLDWQGVIRRLRHQDGLKPNTSVTVQNPRPLPGKKLDENDKFLLRNFNLDEWVGVVPDPDQSETLFSDRQFWPPAQMDKKVLDASYIVGFSYSSRKVKVRLNA